jgi:predicted protein tyrosine phosphatase
MTGKIIICRADEAAEKAKALKPAAVLSIEHPGAEEGHGRAPRLKGVEQKILTFWDSEQPVTGGPDIGQVEQGIAFVVENLLKGDVIVHCHKGKARSAALALGALAQVYPFDSETALIERLLKIRPEAAPNILVVEMADKLAGREGQLLSAVKNHPALCVARAKAEEGRARWISRNPEKFPKM